MLPVTLVNGCIEQYSQSLLSTNHVDTFLATLENIVEFLLSTAGVYIPGSSHLIRTPRSVFTLVN